MRRHDYSSTVVLSRHQEDWVQEVRTVGTSLSEEHKFTYLMIPHRTNSIINQLIVYAVNRGTLTTSAWIISVEYQNCFADVSLLN